MPGHVTQGDFKRSLKKEFLHRGCQKVFMNELPIGPSQKNLETSTNAEHLQDPNARTYWSGFQQDLHTILDLHEITQGHLEDFTRPLQDLLIRTCTRSRRGLWKHFSRICTRSPHKDMCKIMQGPCRGFHQDLDKVLSQGIVKTLTKMFMP